MSRRRTLLLVLVTAALGVVAVPSSAQVPGSDGLVEAMEVADAALVADAGDSVLVDAGQDAVLPGTQFGGRPGYTYHWTTSAGALADDANPTAVVDTTGLAPGAYTATLQVTDAAGDTARDDVTFAVGGNLTQEVLLDQSRTDTQGGVTGVSDPLAFDVAVPEGVSRIDVEISWGVATNDYDLRVLDPDGAEAGSSGGAPPATSEATGVASPTAGTWTVAADRYAVAPGDTVTATVVATVESDGSLLEVDANGPYEFEVGRRQQLAATVVGVPGDRVKLVAWDLDLDGRFERRGDRIRADLAPGRHLVSVKATSTDGFERREMTSVLVGTPEQLRDQATPLTVIGVADSGINPYHAEFSAATYPDPEVLELTRNFTRHPSEYLPGYPADAKALPISTGDGYYPDVDRHLWSGNAYVQPGQLHWIPGTKIIGAIDAGGSTGVTSGADVHPILDDNGHGTGSASVSAGNRYGYCGTCLLVMTEALDESVAAKYPWIDISTNSFGYIGGLPIGYVAGPSEVTRAAAERGQTTLFAAGNGVGNTFFDAPILTYGSDQTGPDWNITVGALREDTQGAIISDGVPAHLSALGDGDLPSACRTGEVGQCAFGGTSAATPYTAGVFGRVLTEVRDALGDHSRAGQLDDQVVATGAAIAASPMLADGRLDRRELRAVVLKTAVPRFAGEQPDRFYPLPQQWNLEQAHYVFEGYGGAGPASADRAVEVLLGARALPARPQEDAFFATDCRARDAQYGTWDRDGDGTEDGCDESSVGLTGTGAATDDQPSASWFDAARDEVSWDEPLAESVTYHLHRRPVFEPDVAPPADDPYESGGPCAESFNEQSMSRDDGAGNVDECYDQRVTSTVAAFRPKGIFAATDILADPIPAGSLVEVAAYVKTLEPAVTELRSTLKATDRAIGASERVTALTNPTGWTVFEHRFRTQRPVAAGEQLSFHFQLFGAVDYAFGYAGGHASRVTITPEADAIGQDLDFGVTVQGSDDGLSGRVAFPDLGPDPQLAGFHPTTYAVQVSVGDPDFRNPVYARIDRDLGTWSTDLVDASDGPVHVRALRDRFPSPVVSLG